MDKDRKAAKGIIVGKVAKVLTVKSMPAKEAIPVKEVRPAKVPTGVKLPGLEIVVKSTPSTTTSSPNKSVKRPMAPDPAWTKRDAKTGKWGPAPKSIPIAYMVKWKLVTKPGVAARGILATEEEHGIQGAPKLASITETCRPSSQGLSLAEYGQDFSR